MNRIDRLLAQILFLQSRPIVTAEDMAARVGLSVRTIYRDLAALAEAGVPIAAARGWIQADEGLYAQCRLLRAFVSNGTSWALTLPAPLRVGSSGRSKNEASYELILT